MDDSFGVTIPQLTYEQAMVLLYHYETGRARRDRMVNWSEMIAAMQTRYGFAAYDAATRLRDNFTPPLLLFRPGMPEENTHRLPEACFRDPTALFRAINEAEAAHNRKIDEIASRNMAAEAEERLEQSTKGAFRPRPREIPSPVGKVAITPMPDLNETIGLVMAGDASQRAAAPTIKVGDFTVLPDGRTAQLVQDATGRPALVPVQVQEAAPPGNGHATPHEPPPKQAPRLPAAKATGARGTKPAKRGKGHEVG